MLRLKARPGRRGDIHENRDRFGMYAECPQCGCMRDMQDAERLARLPEFAAEGDGKKSAA